MAAAFIAKLELNILWIIGEGILEKVLNFSTTLPFSFLVTQLLWIFQVPFIPTVYRFSKHINNVDIALIKDLRNLAAPSQGALLNLTSQGLEEGEPVIEILTSESGTISPSTQYPTTAKVQLSQFP